MGIELLQYNIAIVQRQPGRAPRRAHPSTGIVPWKNPLARERLGRSRVRATLAHHERAKTARRLRRRGDHRARRAAATAASGSPVAAMPSMWRSISPVPASTPPSPPRSATTPIPRPFSRSPPPKASPATWCCACAAGCPASPWSTATPTGRGVATIGVGEAPARELFELADWGRVAEGLMKAKLDLFLRHHAVALFQ